MRLRHTLIALLLATLSAAAQSAEPARRKVIIDDDGFGLMHVMLLESRDVEVLGLTTVSGNAWANRVTATTLRTLENIDRAKVPVAQGATFPLVNSEALTDRWEALDEAVGGRHPADRAALLPAG
jgi:inosine-uridine nucleoside N-ribohydrolase